MTVHVVGNVTEDIVFSVPHLPAPGETLIASERLVDMGGKGLNQAVLLARAGCAVRLVAAVGADEAGTRAEAYAGTELPGSRLLVVDAPTDQSIIAVASDGENHIISSAAAAGRLDPGAAVRAIGPIGADDAVVVQGNLTRETTRAVLAAGRDGGAWTVANPSPIRWAWDDLLPLCDLVIVNRRELAVLTGSASGRPADLLACRAGAVLLTLGAEGAMHTTAAGEASVAAAAVDAVDTAGAGDTFLAAFVAAILGGRETAFALRAAAAAAALTVSRAGTSSAFPSRREMLRCLEVTGSMH